MCLCVRTASVHLFSKMCTAPRVVKSRKTPFFLTASLPLESFLGEHTWRTGLVYALFSSGEGCSSATFFCDGLRALQITVLNRFMGRKRSRLWLFLLKLFRTSSYSLLNKKDQTPPKCPRIQRGLLIIIILRD